MHIPHREPGPDQGSEIIDGPAPKSQCAEWRRLLIQIPLREELLIIGVLLIAFGSAARIAKLRVMNERAWTRHDRQFRVVPYFQREIRISAVHEVAFIEIPQALVERSAGHAEICVAQSAHVAHAVPDAFDLNLCK